MKGCPNRCRHCDMGLTGPANMSESDVRWGVQKFRNYINSGRHPHIKRFSVSTWFREPDFSDEYKHLYELEKELSDDSKSNRHELLSIWRLARDEEYGRWASKIGPDKCQISFFGLEENTDWFYRRKGAFKDAITATERLLKVGMKPRWQLFLTRKILPEIAELLKITYQMKLRDRVKILGGEFELFMHTPSPIDAPCDIEHLRPTIEELTTIPNEIVESSKKYLKTECLWFTEAELIAKIMKEEEKFPYGLNPYEMLWFFVKGNWDVFSNLGSLEAWWKLGNLKMNSVEQIINNFENNVSLALQTSFSFSPKELTRNFGTVSSTRIYDSKGDLLTLYLSKYYRKRMERK